MQASGGLTDGDVGGQHGLVHGQGPDVEVVDRRHPRDRQQALPDLHVLHPRRGTCGRDGACEAGGVSRNSPMLTLDPPGSRIFYEVNSIFIIILNNVMIDVNLCLVSLFRKLPKLLIYLEMGKKNKRRYLPSSTLYLQVGSRFSFSLNNENIFSRDFIELPWN